MGQCTALNVSDELPCQETATSRNGLFCPLHSKQCQGLYRGYKRRNAQLDKLSESPPRYLAESKTPLINQLFSDVTTEDLCKELHDYLFQKLQLLERVIRARKLHHSRFFSMNYDYGHIDYLNQLQTQRNTVVKGLERIERRTAEILYHKQKWFKWVRECQDEEEANREKEQKKVKMEAALFKRHWKEVQQRLEELRVKEWHKKQDAALEQAYKESLTEDEDDGSDWDPIDDVVEDNRENFLDLIKRFLWMPEEPKDIEIPAEINKDAVETGTTAIANLDISEAPDDTKDAKPADSKSKKSKASKKKKNKSSQVLSNTSTSKVKGSDQKSSQEVDKDLIETREQMHDRLVNGTDYVGIVGVMVGGTEENPEIDTKTPTYPEEKAQKLLAEITEIKHLLFCRLLLGHATLLPAALRAESVEAFLSDPEVTEAALRDLCLKMERPGLQEIRDACADLFRGDKEENLDEESDHTPEDDSDDKELFFKPKQPKDALPTKWVPSREKRKEKTGWADQQQKDEFLERAFAYGDSGGILDFGEIKDGERRGRKMIRVRICGRTIWNYPSAESMNRRGWLHFCLLAKDSSLYEAINLCRGWDEFYELNILAIWDYFPSARWARWVGKRHEHSLRSLGFIVYSENTPDAETSMREYRTGPFSAAFKQGQVKLEARNWMCANIKRDDPVSRRFLQYLSMSSECLLLVRDAETGKILIKPPEDQRWLMRGKSNLPRGSRGPWAKKGRWDILQEIGPNFFEEMDKFRKWNFSFKEHYDVYVWDVAVGEPFTVLFNAVQDNLIKAHRCKSGLDIFDMAAPILKELTWAEENKRIRDLEPGEDKESVWDRFHSSDVKFVLGKADPNDLDSFGRIRHIETPRDMFYNAADALEDEVLFPEDTIDPLAVGEISTSKVWEEAGLSFKRFMDTMFDSDTDYESGSDEDDDEDEDDDDEEYEIAETDDGDDEWVSDDEKGPLDYQPSPAENLMIEKLLKSMEAETQDPLEKMREKMKNLTRDDFVSFQLKEQARVFKEAWHQADLEPGAQEHYIEMLEMARAARKHVSHEGPFGPQSLLGFSICKLVDPKNSLDDDPEEQKDMMKAVEKLTPFFFPSFRNSKVGRKYDDSLLLNQEERAKSFPDYRSSKSVTEQPKEFWSEWEKVKKNMKTLEDVPFEWDVAIRPIIARLYKAGVLRTKKNDEPVLGQAIAAKDASHSKKDLYVDYRRMIPMITMPPGLVNPAAIPSLKATAQSFSQKHPTARFALLRVWSAPHFYPLMLGPESRADLAFQDLVGRDFVWMFIPKDMMYSERSIHMNCANRIKPYAHIFGDKVVVKKDTYLVMGVDDLDLMRLATAVLWAVQKKPWRMEVDLWKSFVGVEWGFLEGLREEWFE